MTITLRGYPLLELIDLPPENLDIREIDQIEQNFTNALQNRIGLLDESEINQETVDSDETIIVNRLIEKLNDTPEPFLSGGEEFQQELRLQLVSLLASSEFDEEGEKLIDEDLFPESIRKWVVKEYNSIWFNNSFKGRLEGTFKHIIPEQFNQEEIELSNELRKKEELREVIKASNNLRKIERNDKQVGIRSNIRSLKEVIPPLKDTENILHIEVERTPFNLARTTGEEELDIPIGEEGLKDAIYRKIFTRKLGLEEGKNEVFGLTRDNIQDFLKLNDPLDNFYGFLAE